MINFHIPGIAKHLNLNLKLINLMKINPEYFYDNIKISGVFGSFFCPWTGGRANDCFLDKQKKEEIIKTFNNLKVGILFTYTNTVLEQRDLYDMYGNEDLELISSNPLNKVIIVSDLLKEYIHNKHPNIQFISSITDSREDKGNDYEINIINASKNNSNELFNIKDKEKIELLLNSNCIKNCPYEKEHYDYISKSNVFKAADFFECPFETRNSLEEMKKSEIFISVEDLYNKYVPAGFSIFKINGRHAEDKDVLDYYLYYMVKPEYKDLVKEILEEAI